MLVPIFVLIFALSTIILSKPGDIPPINPNFDCFNFFRAIKDRNVIKNLFLNSSVSA